MTIPNVNSIIFDGVDLERFGVVPTAVNTMEAPTRDFTVKSVPGRNGDIIIDNNRFSNISISYSCYISSNFQENFSSLKAFLLSRKGYVRLEDTYDPEHFREAYYSAAIVPNLSADYDAGSFELTFMCKPQRFLRSGEYDVIFNAEESETGFILPGYEKRDYLGSNISTDSGDIYIRSLAYARSGNSIIGTETYRGFYFIVPGGSAKSIKVSVSGEEESGALGWLGYSYYSIGERSYSFVGTGNTPRASITINLPARDKDWFVCVGSKPERADVFMVDDAVVYSEGAFYVRSIENPTHFPSAPLIKMSGIPTDATRIRLFVIGEQTITATGMEESEIYIDCDGMFAYAYGEGGDIVNISNKISFLDDIELAPGKTDFSANPQITVSIKPRWWSI